VLEGDQFDRPLDLDPGLLEMAQQQPLMQVLRIHQHGGIDYS